MNILLFLLIVPSQRSDLLSFHSYCMAIPSIYIDGGDSTGRGRPGGDIGGAIGGIANALGGLGNASGGYGTGGSGRGGDGSSWVEKCTYIYIHTYCI